MSWFHMQLEVGANSSNVICDESSIFEISRHAIWLFQLVIYFLMSSGVLYVLVAEVAFIALDVAFISRYFL